MDALVVLPEAEEEEERGEPVPEGSTLLQIASRLQSEVGVAVVFFAAARPPSSGCCPAQPGIGLQGGNG